MPPIKAGARRSPLSKVQVAEISREIPIEPVYFDTVGDKDKETSLRTLDKTDFFTKEIDEALIRGECRVGIHSAKDLPDPLPDGLVIAAITKGVDSSDSLVVREELGPSPLIATSSKEREKNTSLLYPDAKFCDIRGTIGERIDQLINKQCDGVVIAEAALIRLGLTHLKRITLPGKATKGQGQLAVVCREGDEEMRLLFSKIDTRPGKRTLYLGLDPCAQSRTHLFHLPLITTVPLPLPQEAEDALEKASHVVFTSKMGVKYFFEHFSADTLQDKQVYCVGHVTASHVRQRGAEVDRIADEETAEGVVELFTSPRFVFWGRSKKARPVITDYLEVSGIPHYAFDLYDTITQVPFKPDLSCLDEIIFTSPSTVDAFLTLYDELPPHIELVTQGPITRRYLDLKYLTEHR